MLVYTATKNEFVNDVMTNQIVDEVLACYKASYGYIPGPSQIRAFQNSLLYMNNVIVDKDISGDVGIAIEYNIPLTNKKIDFLITGKNEQGENGVIIVELKQWSEALPTDKDGIVATFTGGAEREVSHPSYQAWTYAVLLKDFNESIGEKKISVSPCAYLHNYKEDGILSNNFYGEYLDKAPIFYKDDMLKLREFIKKFVKNADTEKLLYEIDNGRIAPSKDIAEKLLSMLDGNKEFIMIDDQKVVYENALKLAKESNEKNKNVLIVEGGPGTGKSVVAINLLVDLTSMKPKRLNARYVTKNAAPRAVFESKLSGKYTKTEITNFFTGSGSFMNCDPNQFDALIVDEAHRLNMKSGLFSNMGENQVKEIIESSKFSIFFIDEDQKVTLKDIGEKEEIIRCAKNAGANIHFAELQSQFRCNGSDGYLAWLDQNLQIRETANQDLTDYDYDFKVFDDPNRLKEEIFKKNKKDNKARIVAGYCWNWVSKKYPGKLDIEIPEYEFEMKWNLASDGGLWSIKPESVSEVGCIHTVQGLQLDYVGVIIGPDLVVRNGQVITDYTKRAKTDASLKGIGVISKEDPDLAKKKSDAIIKNTYRTLMTRGTKGCYIFCTDKETAEFFKERIRK